MIDCFLVGFNDFEFDEYVSSVGEMGTDGGAYRDLNLAFVTHGQKHYRSMDLLNLFHDVTNPSHRPFSNVDFIWPVITYLYTYLAKRGFTIDYINLFQAEKQRLITALEGGEVRAVAITTTLYVWMMPILEIVDLVRTYSSSAKIIVGGPYIHNQARALEPAVLRQFLDSLGADIYVISPEGESTLAQVLQAIRDGGSFASIPNLVYFDGGTMTQTPERLEQNALAEEMVDYSLFSAAEFNGFVSLRTAKSCPFACAFCAFPERAGGYTYLPANVVEKELDAIRAVDSVTTLTFIDDTFNVPKQRFKDIMNMMIRNGYGFRWNSYLRADHVDAECIDLMQRSGCEGVFLGVESGSDRMLKAMNKTARREHYMCVIPQLRASGITVHANLIIGFPGETDDTIRETIDLIETARPDFFRAQLWYCDPTTPIWRQRDEIGIRGSAFRWSHQTMDSATASEWVERIFREVKGADWLPQYGFEPWSLYYLQRRGMTMEGIHSFIRAFNAAVLDKLTDSARPEITPERLQALRAASMFHDRAQVSLPLEWPQRRRAPEVVRPTTRGESLLTIPLTHSRQNPPLRS
jgi:radical SAM PhpK family P-methyltransferase